MFSRRHPFLYFILVLSTLACISFLGISSIIIGGAAVFQDGLLKGPDESRGNIGVVEISGIISSSKDTIAHLKAFRDQDRIKAVIIRIDSPGGGVAPSQEIYREILKTREKKKVIASLGSVAASGGYYAAVAADGIMANPGTITGSIGVIMEFANIRELMGKIGIEPVVIKSGEFKDIGSPARMLTDKERAILQGVADEIHSQFVGDVARQRNIQEEDVIKLADGRIYTGETAVSLALVDRLGNFDDALHWAGELAGIDGKPVPVYPEEEGVMVVKKLFQSLLKDADIAGTVSNYFRFIVN